MLRAGRRSIGREKWHKLQRTFGGLQVNRTVVGEPNVLPKKVTWVCNQQRFSFCQIEALQPTDRSVCVSSANSRTLYPVIRVCLCVKTSVVWDAQLSWGALMLSWGKWLDWVPPAREDSRMWKHVFVDMYMLSEGSVWYSNGFIGMLPQKVAVLSQEYISRLVKNTRIVSKSMFSATIIDTDHLNTENRINSRYLPSFSLPCLSFC